MIPKTKAKTAVKRTVTKPVKKIGEPLASAKRLADATNPDRHHMAQVTKLALALFDKLMDLHGLGARDRLLLEITALLHDIGWSRTTDGGHHKHSRDMILEAELPGLTEGERTLCALIARYHNKAEPDVSRHKGFAALKKKERALVSWLAAILRVADGLDCTHRCAVRIGDCELSRKRLTISLAARGESAAEISGAENKSSLLGRMADRELVFRLCS
ncbi:MAG: HD domain-containing protein [Syntrophales bacterium]|nr:HD domain-containing protein [Syntrophales bacterium]